MDDYDDYGLFHRWWLQVIASSPGALIIVNCDSIAGRLSGGTTGSDYIQAEAEAEASAGETRSATPAGENGPVFIGRF